jgi:hypothetical protein
MGNWRVLLEIDCDLQRGIELEPSRAARIVLTDARAAATPLSPCGQSGLLGSFASLVPRGRTAAAASLR